MEATEFLDRRYLPMLMRFVAINAEPDSFVWAYEHRVGRKFDAFPDEGGYTVRDLKADGLEMVLDALVPLWRGSSNRYAVVPTAGDWVTVFSNKLFGLDVIQAAKWASKWFGSEAVRVSSMPSTRHPQTGSGLLGSTQLGLYRFGDPVRIVAAVQDDDRWEWQELGEPLEFEDLNAYRRRRIRDRFTPEMLVA